MPSLAFVMYLVYGTFAKQDPGHWMLTKLIGERSSKVYILWIGKLNNVCQPLSPYVCKAWSRSQNANKIDCGEKFKGIYFMNW